MIIEKLLEEFLTLSFCNPMKILNKMVTALNFFFLCFFGPLSPLYCISNLSYNPNLYPKNTEIPCHWQGHE